MSYSYTVEVDLEDILNDMSEEEVIDLFETYTGKTLHAWGAIYEKRKSMTDTDFLTYIDKLIMDATGRIL